MPTDMSPVQLSSQQAALVDMYALALRAASTRSSGLTDNSDQEYLAGGTCMDGVPYVSNSMWPSTQRSSKTMCAASQTRNSDSDDVLKSKSLQRRLEEVRILTTGEVPEDTGY